MKLTLVMPMGGGGTRFANHGFDVPKPLIPIYGKPFFYWAARSVEKFVELERIVFVVLQEHIDRFAIDREIRKYFPAAEIVVIPEVLPGAVLTCKAGLSAVPESSPILFNDCDHLFTCGDFAKFCESQRFDAIDGGLLTFTSDEDKYSYARVDDSGYVCQTAEKEVISSNAICGAYYFRSPEVFRDAVEIYLENCRYKEFFVSGVYNMMIGKGLKIAVFGTDQHVSFGTPEEYDAALADTTYTGLI